MNNTILTHFYEWQNIDDSRLVDTMKKFVDAKEQYLAIGDYWTKRFIESHEFVNVLKKAFRDSGATPYGAHAPFGLGWDLINVERDGGNLEHQGEVLKILAQEFGVKTVTIHLGLKGKKSMQEARAFARESMERLLPLATENKIRMAIENGVMAVDTPAELVEYVKYFDSPYLRCCFDSGHAHIITREEGKTVDDMIGWVKDVLAPDFCFLDDPLAIMAPYVTVCHLHDNDGRSDAHLPAGKGTINWAEMMKSLKKCPELLSIENESNYGECAIDKQCADIRRHIIMD